MIGQPLRHFQVCGSTNDEAWRWAQEGAPHGAAVRADSQTAGRGRQGRTWNSPAGRGLYISFILRPEIEMSKAARLTIVAALAGVRAIEELSGCKAATKWPNDIVLGERKIGGVLCEARSAPADNSQIEAAVIGIGLNLNLSADDLPEAPKIPASSLFLETGRRFEVDDAAELLGAKLEIVLSELLNGGWDGMRREFETLDMLQGREVLVDTGHSAFSGVASGIDSDGILCVAVAGELRRVVAGDVILAN